MNAYIKRNSHQIIMDFETVATKENTIIQPPRKMMLPTSPTMRMPSKLALRKTKRPFTKSYIFIYGPIPTLKQQAGEVYNQEESQKLQDCRPVIVI